MKLFSQRKRHGKCRRLAGTVLLGVATAFASSAAMAEFSVVHSFVPAKVVVGAEGELEIKLTNTNTAPTTGTWLDVPLDDGIGLTGVNSGCGGTWVHEGGMLKLTGMTIPGGGVDHACTITGTVTSTTPGTYPSFIPAGDSQGGSDNNGGVDQASSATFTVDALAPITGIKRFNPTTIRGGQTSTITITLSNSNPVDLTGVELLDDGMHTRLALADPANYGGTCLDDDHGGTAGPEGSNGVEMKNVTLPANSNCTLTFDVTVADPGAYVTGSSTSNSIAAGNVTADGITAESKAFSRSVTVRSGARIRKTFSPDPTTHGLDSATMTFTITNYNGFDLKDMAFTDDLPASIQLGSVAGGSCIDGGGADVQINGNSVVFSGGTLDAVPGTSGTTSCTVVVNYTPINTTGEYINPQNGTGDYTNTTYVADGGQHDGESFGFNLANSDVIINPITTSGNGLVHAEKRFSKSPDATGGSQTLSSIPQGNTVYMVLKLINTNPNNAAEVKVHDDLSQMDDRFTLGAGSIELTDGSTSCSLSVSEAAGAQDLNFTGAVPAGESCTFTIPVKVEGDAKIGNSKYNFVGGGTLGGDNNLEYSYDSWSTQGSWGGITRARIGVVEAITVGKEFSPQDISAGAPNSISQLTITVNREKDVVDLTGLEIHDTYDNHALNILGVESNTCGGSVDYTNAGEIHLTGGELLAPGDGAANSCELVLNVNVTDDTFDGEIENTLAAGEAIVTAQGLTNVEGVTATLNVSAAGIALDKQFSPTQRELGEITRLTLLLGNTGGAPAQTGVELTDTLPAGTFVADDPNWSFSGACGSNTDEGNVNVTSAGGLDTIEITGVEIAKNSTCEIGVDVVANALGNLINVIPGGTMQTASGLVYEELVDATVQIFGDADVAVVIDNSDQGAGNPLTPGGDTEYTVTVWDNGPEDVAGNDVTIVIPAGVTPDVSSITQNAEGGAIPVDPSNISSEVDDDGNTVITITNVFLPTSNGTDGNHDPSGIDDYLQFVIPATVDADLTDEVTATAHINPTTPVTEPEGHTRDAEDGNNFSNVSNPVGEAALLLTKAASPVTFTAAGQDIGYTFTITNDGDLTITNLSITDPDIAASVINLSSPGTGVSVDWGTATPGQLAKAESVTVTVDADQGYSTTADDLTNGSKDNTATANGTDLSQNPVPEATATATIRAARIALDKSVDGEDSGLRAGDKVSYQFVITNNGAVALDRIVLVDNDLDPAVNLNVDATTAEADWSDATTPGELQPGESVTVTLADAYELTQGDVNHGGFTNTAATEGVILGADPEADDNVTVTDEDSAEVTTSTTSSISLTKAADPGVFTDAGQDIGYTFTITNDGDVTIAALSITDDLIAASPIDLNAPGAGVSVDWGAAATEGQLDHGESVTVTVDTDHGYTTTADDLEAGHKTNTATANGEDPDGEDVPSDPAEATVHAAKIDLVKSADPASGLVAGDEVTYTFTATNTGEVTLEDVQLTDDASAFTGTGGALTLTDFDWSSGTEGLMEPGDTVKATATYELTQQDVNNGSVFNAADVSGVVEGGDRDNDEDVVSAHDDETVTPSQVPAIKLEKSVKEQTGSNAGDAVTYEFEATNTGSLTLVDVEISEDDFSGTGTLGDLENFDWPDEDNEGVLQPGESVTATASYTLTQADVNAGTVTNDASVTGKTDTPDPQEVEDDDDAEVTAEQTPAISLIKDLTTEVPDGGFEVGAEISYGFTVENIGNVTLTDVVITDPLPGLSEITFGDWPGADGVLQPGEFVTAEADYTITQDDVDAGGVDNLATTSGTPPSGGPVEDDDDATAPTKYDPSISLTKEITSNRPYKEGDRITYRFTVENTGNVTLTNVSITDDKLGTPADPAIVCEATELAPGESTVCEQDVDSDDAGYQVTADDMRADKVENTATTEGTPPVTDENPDPDPVTDEDTAETRLRADVAPIPTLGEWALIGLAMLLAGFAVSGLRRRRRF